MAQKHFDQFPVIVALKSLNVMGSSCSLESLVNKTGLDLDGVAEELAELADEEGLVRCFLVGEEMRIAWTDKGLRVCYSTDSTPPG